MTVNEPETIRFKIIYALVKNGKPMKLTEIANEAKLLESHVRYHLKNLKECFAVVEIKGKGYVCQPFLTDKAVSEDLKSLMGVIVRLISRELVIPEGCTDDVKMMAVIRNLEAFIRSYSAEFFQ